MKFWSKNELDLAIDLCENGFKYEEIANKLNRTKKSIKVKLNKLGYKQNHDINYVEIICKNCGIQFKALKKQKRKYCSQSCSATINNKLYPKRIKLNEEKRIKLNKRKRIEYHKRKKNKCLNCGTITTNKYCSSLCQSEYRRKFLFTNIENENGDFTHSQVKKYLINKYGEKCMECGWSERNQYTCKIPIELEHIDGNSLNNKLYNLKLLCPNCHSLTSTYKGANAGNGRHSRKKRYQEGKSY